MSTSLATCPQNAAAADHQFTALRPGWHPDDSTPCDCGAVSWQEHQRELARRFAEQSRDLLDQQLRAEVDRPRKVNPPGPNPSICSAPDAGDPSRICGGRMSTPVLGRRSHLWVRTCTVCRSSTHSETPPPGVANRPARLPAPVPGALFSSTIETVSIEKATPARMERVAKQAGLFDRKRRAARDER